ncbi:hypothetical protein GCM10009759_59020 [Kitasatospora saccharophila]|uniref:Uncharacterized protein n=1 Tax=Kitasatospora saccharophila TaxID=407973 RepID=A0ABN2XM01_9ACTN
MARVSASSCRPRTRTETFTAPPLVHVTEGRCPVNAYSSRACPRATARSVWPLAVASTTCPALAVLPLSDLNYRPAEAR